MKFIVISDVHLGCNLFNLPELGEDLFTLFSFMVDKAIEMKVDYFISLGDIFDSNKPQAASVDFVQREVQRLKSVGIKPIAISGDHSKSINDVDWEYICRFDFPSDPIFAAANYNDVPESVMGFLRTQLESKAATIEFVFLHGMVPEIWAFCDEKKKLPIKQLLSEYNLPNLKAVILGDIHKPFETKFVNPPNKEYFAGYCGSLGVTRLDEIVKTGFLYFDGTNLQRVPYKLPRKILEIQVTSDWLNALTEVEKSKSIDLLKKHTTEHNDKKPVVILKCDSQSFLRLQELGFIYENAIVRTGRLKSDGKLEIVRSEISGSQGYESVLKRIESLNTEVSRNLALSLLQKPDDAKLILDNYKKQQFV